MLYNEAQEKFVEYMKGKQMSKETISGYEKNLNYFKRYLIAELRHASLKLEEITLQHLLSYRTYLQATRQLKPASQQRYLTAIRSFFTFLHHYEYIDNNITNKLDNIKIPRTQRAWLTIPELEKLIQAIQHPIIRFAVELIGYTGIRVSEAINLKLSDIDFQHKVLHIKGKGSKERIVPISNKLQQKMDHYFATTRPIHSEYLLATTKTQRLSRQYLNITLKKAAQSINISQPITAHILRHTFATAVARNSQDLPSLQKILGHESLRTTGIYLHTQLDQLMDAVNTI